MMLLCIVLTSESLADKMGECILTPEIWSVGVLPDAKNSNNSVIMHQKAAVIYSKKFYLTKVQWRMWL